MTTPIRAKPRASMKIDNAPTPHNTPASVLSNSYLKNGIPSSLSNNNINNSSTTGSTFTSGIPQTIHEEDLLHSIQDKLGSLVGTDSGYIDSLPKKVKQRVMALSALQQQLFQLEREFQIEMFELEQKYLRLYSPVFERRAKIVSGEVEPTEVEIKEGEELSLLAKEEEESGEEAEEAEEEPTKKDTADSEPESESDAKGIPAFWLTALENLPIVNETITDRDAGVLEHLTDIKLQYLESGKPGFKLVFEFNPDTNTYFSNPTLTKTYYYQSELGYSGDFIYDHAEGEEIKWLSNAVNVTVLVETRKQRNKHTKQIRTIERLTPVESFFNFFDPPTVDNNDDDDKDKDKGEKTGRIEGEQAEADEEEEEDLEARLALDYSIGEQIKDKLIPRAVDWFTGAALEFEFMDESEGEGDEEEEGEFDDDDDDDDDDSEQEENGEHDDFKGVKEEPPECKQQ